MNKIFLFIALMTFSNLSFAVTPFWLGVGNLTHNFSSAQSDVSGGTKKFEFGPTILIGTSMPFYFPGSYFSPGIGLAKFFTEDDTTKTEFILQYHVNQEVLSNFYFRYGFSTYITRIGGSGKDLELNNGNGTSTFYAPSTSKNTYTSSLDLGGEFILDTSWAVRVQASILRFLSSERRRVSHLLTANYFF